MSSSRHYKAFNMLIDVNPCDTENGGCEHMCENIRGKATCSCLSGKLNTDEKNCDDGKRKEV